MQSGKLFKPVSGPASGANSYDWIFDIGGRHVAFGLSWHAESGEPVKKDILNRARIDGHPALLVRPYSGGHQIGYVPAYLSNVKFTSAASLAADFYTNDYLHKDSHPAPNANSNATPNTATNLGRPQTPKKAKSNQKATGIPNGTPNSTPDGTLDGDTGSDSADIRDGDQTIADTIGTHTNDPQDAMRIAVMAQIGLKFWVVIIKNGFIDLDSDILLEKSDLQIWIDDAHAHQPIQRLFA